MSFSWPCSLSSFITLVHDDAGRALQRIDPSAYDLIFLDSERSEYPGWWLHLRRVLRPGGLLIVDNATSHVEQMALFVALVTADAGARVVQAGRSPLGHVAWVARHSSRMVL